jgi:small-conductance mechanosensitive channel
MTLSAVSASPRRLLPALLLAVCACFTLAPVALAQDTPPAAQTEAPAAPSPAPIAASDIPRRAENAIATLRDLERRSAPQQRADQVAEQLEQARQQIETMAASPALADPETLSLRALRDLENQWGAVGSRLNGWQTTVSGRAQFFQDQTRLMREQRVEWQLTLDTRKEEELPEATIQRVRDVLKAFDESETRLRDRRDWLVTQGSRISELRVQVDSVLSLLDSIEDDQRYRLLVRDSDPLWTALGVWRDEHRVVDPEADTPTERDDAQELITEEISHVWETGVGASVEYLRTHVDRLLAALALFAALTAMMVMLRRKSKVWDSASEYQVGTIDVIAHPVATAALLVLAFGRPLFPGAPLALFDIARLISVIPLAALFRTSVDLRHRALISGLLVLYGVDTVRSLLSTQPLAGRLSLLVIGALTLAVVIRAARLPPETRNAFKGPWGVVFRWVPKIAIFTLTGSILANLFGMVGLASLLGESTLFSMFIALGMFALSQVLVHLIGVLTYSPLGRSARAMRRNPALIRKRVERGLNLIAVLLWAGLTLRLFKLLEPVRDAIVSVFTWPLSVGAFSVSLSDIAAFVVALWVGVVLSRLIRFILEEDVFTRVRLPRGVPATIATMVNYGIITIAFFVALAMAGFDLSRFAIIAGALSVGIGFGLQNVVNNFVSGLILAFERPISVGDSVQVGTMMGRVTRIGIRSSVVRTFDGSEVIVPNADFISKEVVNWTLSDVTRRQILPAGVAYGSNPHQVLELLVRVALEHPEVLDEPEPYALFIGFGASSLDFELRCWCPFADGLRIKTELNLAIHDALREEGIEIPFPQQDLHLKTVTERAAGTLGIKPGDRYPARRKDDYPDPDFEADTSAISGVDE